MKAFKIITIICAMASLSFACGRDTDADSSICATFTVETPLTKAFCDGSLATDLNVRVFDANHNFLYEQTAKRGDAGWEVTLRLVPGTYSFSFWASSPDADAFSFNREYMTLSYPLMDMNSNTEDAFWASIADIELTSEFSRTVTLKRPFALLQLVSDSFINESLEGATSVFSITGSMCTRLNLITGDVDQANRKAVYTAAPISDYTIGRRTIAAAAFVLVPEEEVTVPEVTYNITLKDGRSMDGTVSDVPLARNHRTNLLDN